ncbi:MAG TPA: hypothetical protein PKE58_21625, partial [Acidobacteriota bacterium]|nr:hypothetical protein [Acidobacteriota bacterium]
HPPSSFFPAQHVLICFWSLPAFSAPDDVFLPTRRPGRESTQSHCFATFKESPLWWNNGACLEISLRYKEPLTGSTPLPIITDHSG